MMASGSSVNKEDFKNFSAKIVKFWRENCQGFPNLDQSSFWKVYLLSKDLLGHYSLLFQDSGRPECLVIELVVDSNNNINQTYFNLKKIDVSDVQYHDIKARDLGVIKEKAGVILGKAYSRLCQMGSYNGWINSCQDYCKHLAEDIGCLSDFSTAKEVTINHIAIGVVAVAGIAVGAALLHAMLSGSKEDESSK